MPVSDHLDKYRFVATNGQFSFQQQWANFGKRCVEEGQGQEGKDKITENTFIADHLWLYCAE